MKAPTPVPTARGALPVVGHTLSFIRSPLGFLESLPRQGELVQVNLGKLRTYVVCHPELVHQVLVNDRVFDKGGVFFEKAQVLFGNGLVTCQHRDHRRQRRLVQPAFHRDRLARYADVMSEQAERLAYSWQGNQEIDVIAAMHEYTAAVTTLALFGGASSPMTTAEIQRYFFDIMSGVTRRMALPSGLLDRIPTPANRRFLRACKRLRQLTDNIIADRRRDGRDHCDLLSMVLAARDGDQGLNDPEVRDQVFNLFFGGIETAATTLSWAWHHLGGHPDLRAQLHAELDSVLDGRAARFSDLSRLRLTEAVITETLRLTPPGWVLTRKTSIDTQLATYAIPAGSTVIYSPYLLGRRADLHDNPDRFDPYRWLRPHTPALPRGSLVPFGGGARKCIGDEFAMAMATIGLATIAARWRLDPLPGVRIRVAHRAVLAPRALSMRLHRRNQANA